MNYVHSVKHSTFSDTALVFYSPTNAFIAQVSYLFQLLILKIRRFFLNGIDLSIFFQN